jgi:DNA-binding Lrp family transcriptional regulator
MSKKLELLDLQILDGLAAYGYRNISNVARKLGIPDGTLRKRLKSLSSHFYLRFHVNLYHTNLGLKKALVFVEAVQGYENLVLNCLKANDFWIYVSRCFGRFEGCLALYAIPKEHCFEFEQFIKNFQKLGVAENVKVLWSTCFQSVQSRCKWFHSGLRKWIFNWDEWVKEILEESTKLPYTLIDPDDFPVKGDEIDLFILKELEKDGTKDLTEIARMLGISQQLAGYHFKKHVVQKGLIESYQVSFAQFDLAVSDTFFFVFRFDNNEKLAKFANSLLDKPFVRSLGKVLNQNSLIAYLYLPRREFRRFVEVLSELIRRRFLVNYFYVIQDLNKTSRQTISYQHFKNKKWIYDHKKHLEKLRSLVEKAKIDKTGKPKILLEA